MKKHIRLLINALFYIIAHTIIGSDVSPEMQAIQDGFKQFLNTLEHLECKPLSGGLSHDHNQLYQCVANNHAYVARVLKKPLPQRKNEIAAHLEAARHQIAPKIYHHNTNDEFSLIIMDLIQGNTLSIDQARTQEVLSHIAHNVRTIQQFDIPILEDQMPKDLWGKIIQFHNQIKDHLPEDITPLLDSALQKIHPIHQRLTQSNESFMFTHNDLNPRNIFFSNDKALFIDWENATINHSLYDLAGYSIFSCLRPAEENHLLAQYLQKNPSDQDLERFNDLKLMIRLYDTCSLLAFLNHIPHTISLDSIGTFEEYETMFAQDSHADSPEFIYKMAVSQLNEFFKEQQHHEGTVK